jgi:hypothetical protein
LDPEDEVGDERLAELRTEAVRLAIEAVAGKGRHQELDIGTSGADPVREGPRPLDQDEPI